LASFTNLLCPDGPLTEIFGLSHEVAAGDVDGSEAAVVLVEGDDGDDADGRPAPSVPLLHDASRTTITSNVTLSDRGRGRSRIPESGLGTWRPR